MERKHRQRRAARRVRLQRERDLADTVLSRPMDQRDENREGREPPQEADGAPAPGQEPALGIEEPAVATPDDSDDSDEFGIGALVFTGASSDSEDERLIARILNEPAPARHIAGRYWRHERLGRGGMGTVYAGYDGKLERKVAIKRLHTRLENDSDKARERLEREAKAMGQLDGEPNVVQVHDIVAEGDQAFLVMEFISGTTLRDSQDRALRSRAEIVDAYLQAGRGLAAIHRVHLVHRDFKPSNVLVTDKGPGSRRRVVVCDLGLAIAQALEVPSSASAPPDPRPAPAERLTATHVLVGTPAYMAPEQLRCERDLDARCDQFAFCVALYEALCGQRPFAEAGRDPDRLLAAIAAGPPRMLKRADGAVPARIEQALRRGLAPKPDDRFPEMDALLAALAPPRRRPWSVWLSVVLAMALGLVLLLGRDATPPCEREAQAAAAGLVDESTVSGREQAAPEAQKPAWRALRAAVKEHVSTWRSEKIAACNAQGRNGGNDTDRMTGLKQECLSVKAARLRTAGDYMMRDEVEVATMFELAEDLDRMQSCINMREQPALDPPTDPASLQAIDAFHATIAASKLLEYEGRYQDAAVQAQDALAQAAAMPFEYKQALVARAQFRRGQALAHAGDHEAALKLIESAAQAAARLHLAELLLDVALFHAKYLLADLEQVAGAQEQLSRVDLLLGWLGLGCGEEDDRGAAVESVRRRWTCAEVHEARGLLASDQQDLERAVEHHHRALAWREKLSAASDLSVFLRSKSLNNLANVEVQLAQEAAGDASTGEASERYWEDAEGHYRDALALRTAAVGPDHPLVDRLLLNIALLEVKRDKIDSASLLALSQRVLARKEARAEVHLESLSGVLTHLIYAALSRYYDEQESSGLDTAKAAAASIEAIHGLMPEVSMQHFRRASEYLVLTAVSEAAEQWPEALHEIEQGIAVLARHDAATTCTPYLQDAHRSALYSKGSILCSTSEPALARDALTQALRPLAACAAGDNVIDELRTAMLQDIPAACHP